MLAIFRDSVLNTDQQTDTVKGIEAASRSLKITQEEEMSWFPKLVNKIKSKHILGLVPTEVFTFL